MKSVILWMFIVLVTLFQSYESSPVPPPPFSSQPASKMNAQLYDELIQNNLIDNTQSSQPVKSFYYKEPQPPSQPQSLLQLARSQSKVNDLIELEPYPPSDDGPELDRLGDDEQDADFTPKRELAAYLKARINQQPQPSRRLSRRSGGFNKRAAAMGVDLPDYILHINKGRNFDFSSFREKMQKSG